MITKKTILFFLSSIVLFVACQSKKTVDTSSAVNADTVKQTFNADSAFYYIQQQCAFGARTPNSVAHEKCRQYIVDQFKRYGLTVEQQKADLKGWDGKLLQSTNIIASYRPELKNRIVIASHWDSRPWCDADSDSSKHREPVMAANDGASGVAVMIELARQLKTLNPTLGIDFVCFDSEDYGAPYWGVGKDDESDWCLGSQYWSAHLPNDYRPQFGILLDMVGAPNSQFKFEYYSMSFAQSVVAKVWDAAESVGASSYFIKEDGGQIIDDHVPMNKIGKIPTIDIIGTLNNTFPPTWHTTQDTPENISKETLFAVGQTLLQVIYEQNKQ